MNTSDKIMQGLACHARSDCGGCPYEDQPECSSKLAADAVELIKTLSRERTVDAITPCGAWKECWGAFKAAQ